MLSHRLTHGAEATARAGAILSLRRRTPTTRASSRACQPAAAQGLTLPWVAWAAFPKGKRVHAARATMSATEVKAAFAFVTCEVEKGPERDIRLIRRRILARR
jgi:hypothetical protein